MVGITVFGIFLAIQIWPAAAKLFVALLGAVSPLVTGFIIAYVVNILMSRYEKLLFPKSGNKAAKKLKRPVSLLLAFVTLVAVVALVIWLIVPKLVDCVALLINELPDAIRSVIDWMEKFHILPEDIISALEKIDWRSRVGEIFNAVTTGIGSVVNVALSVVTSVFSALVSAFLSTIFAIYLLTDKEGILNRVSRLSRRIMPPKWYDRIAYFFEVAHDCFTRYIVGQCTEAVILGALCTAGMLILRLPYATMVGALVAFTALIPVAGAYIGAGVGAFMILTVSPVKALVFIVFLVILQQFEGNVIYPRVVGSSMGLPGIWVLAAVTVGGGIMGIAGMLIGVPLAATAYRLVSRDVRRWETEQVAAKELKAKPEEKSEPMPDPQPQKAKRQKKGKKK